MPPDATEGTRDKVSLQTGISHTLRSTGIPAESNHSLEKYVVCAKKKKTGPLRFVSIVHKTRGVMHL